MSHVPHELSKEFPAHVETMRTLRQTNAHFSRLWDEYHDVNRTVHRVETDIEPSSDARSQELRKERLRLKDEIAAIIRD